MSIDTTTFNEDRRPRLLRPVYDAFNGYEGRVSCGAKEINGKDWWSLVVIVHLPDGELNVVKSGYESLQDVVDRAVQAIRLVLEDRLDAGG